MKKDTKLSKMRNDALKEGVKIVKGCGKIWNMTLYKDESHFDTFCSYGCSIYVHVTSASESMVSAYLTIADYLPDNEAKIAKFLDDCRAIVEFAKNYKIVPSEAPATSVA